MADELSFQRPDVVGHRPGANAQFVRGDAKLVGHVIRQVTGARQGHGRNREPFADIHIQARARVHVLDQVRADDGHEVAFGGEILFQRAGGLCCAAPHIQQAGRLTGADRDRIARIIFQIVWQTVDGDRNGGVSGYCRLTVAIAAQRGAGGHQAERKAADSHPASGQDNSVQWAFCPVYHLSFDPCVFIEICALLS